MTSKSKKPAKRRVPERLSCTLYAYAEPVNAKYARSYGAKNWGSFSAYIDALIAADRKQSLIDPPAKTDVSSLKKAVKKKAKKSAKKSAAPVATTTGSASPTTASEATVQ